MRRKWLALLVPLAAFTTACPSSPDSGIDLEAPVVASFSPTGEGVSVTASFTVKFSEAINPDTVANTVDLEVRVLPADFKSFEFEFGASQSPSGLEYGDPLLTLDLAAGWRNYNLQRWGRRIRCRR